MNYQNISVGVMAALLACTGAAVIVIDAAYAAGYNRSELVSWIFAIYTFGGMTSLYLSFTKKIPLIGAHSLAGVAFIAVAGLSSSISEMAGSFIVSGVIIMLIGSTGIFSKIINVLPVPLINAMLAGILVNYVLKAISAIISIPIIGLASILGFFCMPLISKKLPRFLGAMLFGTVVMVLTVPFSRNQMEEIAFMVPQLVTPSFSISNILFISVPLALIILSNDTAVALTSLKRNNFTPPVSQTVMFSGFASMVAGFFGGHAAGVGGMTTALCSSEEGGVKEKRYWGALIGGFLILLFGIFSWFTVSIIELVPVEFITIIAAFSLLGILISSLNSAFSTNGYHYSTVFTFIIAISNTTFFQISSVIWALVIGIITSWILKEGIATTNDQ